jgi:hypothetical protein
MAGNAAKVVIITYGLMDKEEELVLFTHGNACPAHRMFGPPR